MVGSSVPDVVHGHAEPLVCPAPDVLVEGEEDVFVLVLDVGLDLALEEPRPLEHHRHRLVARHHRLLRRPVVEEGGDGERPSVISDQSANQSQNHE